VKGTRHSEEQIITILKQGEAGLSTSDLCRQHNITEQTRPHSSLNYLPPLEFARTLVEMRA